ncbi:MAG: hypothetical protein R3E01_10780 [Pirellulaceae bacterium]|nr:hypothetical protein [Planctomycetales bacterium]
MHVLLFSDDLLFSSQVEGAARRAGHDFSQCRKVNLLLQQAASGPCVVLLDLSSGVVNLSEIVPQLNTSSSPPLAVIAFGPHVHADRLSQAQQLGCSEVMARGQFHRALPTLFQRWKSDTASDVGCE